MNNPQYPSNPPPYGDRYPAGPDDETIETSANDAAYARSQHERYVDQTGRQVEQREEVVENKNASRAIIRYRIARITYYVLGVLEVILFLRFLFRLLGANEDNAFITFLYDLSHVFVGAFNGIFNDQALGHSVFETSTLVAMIIYALIAWGIVSLGRIVFAPQATAYQNTFTSRRNV